jgi:dTDP-4-amino-4,6-dideoxygalactose transaminase
MTEMQAAIGRVVLTKVPRWVAARRQYAQIFRDAFSKVQGLRVTFPPPEFWHSYYKYYVFVEPESLRPDWNRDRIMHAIAAAGVPCFSGSCSEIYLEKAFDADMRPAARLRVARELGETSLMFLVHPTMSERHINETIDVVRKVMAEAT